MEAPLELNCYLLTLKDKEKLLRTIHPGTFSISDRYIHLLTAHFPYINNWWRIQSLD